MVKLEHPEAMHLQAAEGWLGLGDHIQANEELEKITPELRAHPDVLEMRWHVYAKAGKWDACVDVAAALVKMVPDRPFGWIHRSYALHELKRTQEAVDLPKPAVGRFQKNETIHYNLACYACQLGELKEAWKRLEEAIDLAENPQRVKLMALEDRDLEAFWAEIGEI